MTATNRATRLRERRALRGLCKRCGKAPPRENSSWCESCLQKVCDWRKNRRQQFRAAGLCVNCGVRTAKKSCTWCVRCLRNKNLTQLDLIALRKETGKCPRCGRGKPVFGKSACARCLDQWKIRMRRYRAKKAEAEARESV